MPWRVPTNNLFRPANKPAFFVYNGLEIKLN